MKSLNTLTGDALEQMIDYKVVDQTGAGIGTLHSLWSDPTTGAVEFLGVKTGWLFGHNHVVPAEKAELDDANGVVRLPYTEIFIKEAPSMSADAEISEVEEDDIFRYYGLPRRGITGEADATGIAANDAPTASASPAAVVTATNEEATGSTSKYANEPAPSGDLQAQNLLNVDRGDTSAGNYRLRKTARPVSTATDAAVENTPAIGGMTSPTNDDFINGGAAAITTGEGSGIHHGTSEYDPTASPLGDASLTGSKGVADDTGGNTATTPLTGSEDDTDTDKTTVLGSTATTDNADPITGEHGVHPVGTGFGAASAGAAGMVIGAAVGGGPIGAVIGGIVGALGGGLAGKGLAESVNPTVEDATDVEKI